MRQHGPLKLPFAKELLFLRRSSARQVGYCRYFLSSLIFILSSAYFLGASLVNEVIYVVHTNARVRNALGALLTSVALNVLVRSSSDAAELEALETAFKAAVCVGGPAKQAMAMHAAALQAGAGQNVQPFAGLEFDSIYQFWSNPCVFYLGGKALVKSSFFSDPMSVRIVLPFQEPAFPLALREASAFAHLL
jgi:hypothetical protein